MMDVYEKKREAWTNALIERNQCKRSRSATLQGAYMHEKGNDKPVTLPKLKFLEEDE